MAAMRLRSQPDLAVLEVALGVGFGSTEAFARAFRTRFECTPTEWRNSKHDQSARKMGQAPHFGQRNNGDRSAKETAMNVRLIDREPTHVAYLRYTGPVGIAIGTFWMGTVAPWMGTNNLYGRDRFGISLDDPSITRDKNIRYDACVASPEGETLTGNPQRKVIPGGRYAAMHFKGTGAAIGVAWDALLRDWLPQSGLQLDSRPFFEHYPPGGEYDPKTGAFSCDLCVPVAPL
jgi:AraC family transcriptional regulator